MTKTLFITAVVARLPLAAFSVGVLVHVQHLTGSYAVAGAASGALAVAQGAGGPALGRLADRRGATGVLLGSSAVAATALGLLAALPAGAPLGLILVLAALLGAATPPVGACLRALIPVLFPDRQRRVYAVDTALTELTWVAGPPLALGAGAIWGSGPALASAGVVLIGSTVLFALSPASRRRHPAGVRRAAGGALASPALRTLVAVLVAVGLVFGATEVAVAAAAGPVAAGPLLGLWGAGSLIGGALAVRLGGGRRAFPVLLVLLGVGHAALAAVTGNVVALGAVIVAAGTMIAPILASAYAMVDDAAPAGTATEAFAWLATASAIGTSIGAAVGGVLADLAGPGAGFLLAGVGGLAAAAIAATPSMTRVPVRAEFVAAGG